MLTDTEMERAAGYLEAANNLLAQRFNYALVAHSMALTAYATCSGQNADLVVQSAVAIFGFLYALVQYQITYPLTLKIDALRDATVANDRIYQHYMTAAGGRRFRGLQSKAVPWGLALLWLTLLVHALADTSHHKSSILLADLQRSPTAIKPEVAGRTQPNLR